MSYIIKIDNLYKSFNGRSYFPKTERTTPALLSGVNLEITCGTTMILTGDNGTGKSTLFNIISGFEKADSGDIYVDGDKRLNGLSPAGIARLGVGRMFQSNHIFPDLTLLENLLIADLDEYGEWPFQGLFKPGKLKLIENERMARSETALDSLFADNNLLWQRRNESAGKFSYGQQRLISLARLLVNKHRLLLLDEPTAGIDQQTVPQIISLINRIKSSQNVSIFMIEHNLEAVRALADSFAILDNGKIIVKTPAAFDF